MSSTKAGLTKGIGTNAKSTHELPQTLIKMQEKGVEALMV